METKEDTIMSNSSSEETASTSSASDDRKTCPMPNCKNEVKRGRYCNSCQKRKESLSRSMAQQGIHLNQHRKMKASSSSESLGSKNLQLTLPPPVPTSSANRKGSGGWDPATILIEANKKHRSSEDLFKGVGTMQPIKLPHASEILAVGSMREESDPMDIYSPSITRNRSVTIPQESPRLSRISNSSSFSGMVKEEEPKENKVMRINSILSPSSPLAQRQREAQQPQLTYFQPITQLHPETNNQLPLIPSYQSVQQSSLEEERGRFNDLHAGEMIQWIDSMLVEVSGNNHEATKLLKRYLGSSIGRNRLGASFEPSNP
eukprot:TRINITY_DN1743_c0_g1_i1.p1 TRINITY_DN1743_c0_g1~~TRINITY_DN1743_c0_g1_i1.p1  ORF type:complete len:318 (+),score=79.32 TRINITY_DN1743_c0_g1_i1:341-1294(+)